MVWTETKLNKIITGTIKMIPAPPPAEPFVFSGEFVVSSSPLLDGSKPANELTKADKMELLKVFKDEKDAVDRQQLDLPPVPWPPGY